MRAEGEGRRAGEVGRPVGVRHDPFAGEVSARIQSQEQVRLLVGAQRKGQVSLVHKALSEQIAGISNL